MVIIGGQIYTNHVIVKPKLHRRVLKFLHLISDVYSPKELANTKQYLEVMAAHAIEKVAGITPKQMEDIINNQ